MCVKCIAMAFWVRTRCIYKFGMGESNADMVV